MNRKVNWFFVLFLLLFQQFYLYAHQEWVHQHMVKESYKLLKRQLGYDIPIMKERIGLDLYGPGSGTWETGKVVIGAWREDIDDPVWNVGGIECGFVASSTHFWDADAGDESGLNIYGDWDQCPWENEIPNAYHKALRYYYGGWYLGYNVSPWLRVQKPNGDWLRLIPLVPPGPVYLYYKNLANVYNTKRMHTTFLGLAGMYNETRRQYEWYDGYVIVDSGLIDIFVWEILGRIAHLIGDMSVPAHVKNDPHPCYFYKNYGIVTIDIQNGDRYELWAGGSQSGSQYNCTNPVVHVNAYDWGELQAFQQGGFINVLSKQNPIRYLFYTTNQLADHFGSLATQYAMHYGGLWNPGDNDLNYYYGSDYYAELNYLLSQMGQPVRNQNDFENSKIATMNYPYTFAIRATAGLLYWFAMETDLLQNTLVQNSFGNGKVRVNTTEYPSGYRIPAWNPQATTIEAIDQPFNGCNWLFQNWQKIVNGAVVQTFSSRSITITPEANTTYRANFTQQNPGFYLSSTKSTIYRDQEGRFTINNSNLYTGSADYTWQTFKVAFRCTSVPSCTGNTCQGNICWEINSDYYDGLTFVPNGKTATLYNWGFTPTLLGTRDSLLLVRAFASGCGVNSQKFETIVTLRSHHPPPPPPRPPGGCPLVYTWNGNEYIEDNNILPQSEYSKEEDLVIDYYKLFTEPILTENTYRLRVREFEQEQSTLDNFSLIVVDHPPEAMVSVDGAGEINLYAKPATFGTNTGGFSSGVYFYKFQSGKFLSIKKMLLTK